MNQSSTLQRSLRTLLGLGALWSSFGNLTAQTTAALSPTFNSPADVPVSAATFAAAGNFGTLNLGFAPTPGTILTVVNQAGFEPIQGRFTDLPDGAEVPASFGGQNYVFIAGYAGGTGNDLTLTLVGPGAPRKPSPAIEGGTFDGFALRQDGKMLVVGMNLYLAGHPNVRGAVMLDENRTPIESFLPRFRGSYPITFRQALALPDNKFLAVGTFVAVDDHETTNAVRFNADGSVDTTFTLSAIPYLSFVTPLPDGRFLGLGSDGNQGHLIRINADGSRDATFTPRSAAGVSGVLPLRNGQMIIWGTFDFVDGVARRKVARLHADGTLDPTFTNGEIDAGSGEVLLEFDDGRLLAKGNAGTTSGYLQRLNLDGSVDPSFYPAVLPSVSLAGAALQADGKILIGDGSHTIHGLTRKGITRLMPDGTIDASFAGTSGLVSSIALRKDGEVLVSYGVLAGVTQPGVGQLMNDPASVVLEIPDSSTIRLLQSGSSPACRSMRFDLLAPAGTGWTPLPSPVEIPGGWQLSGLNLPSGGIIRWQGIPSANKTASVLIEGYQTFGEAAPHVDFTGPEGQPLVNNTGGIDFGVVFSGSERVLKMYATNSGDGTWECLAPVISGPGTGAFRIISSPTLPTLPGAMATFEIAFTPASQDQSIATFTVAGSDPLANPFVVTLNGSGGTVLNPTFHSADEILNNTPSFNTQGREFGTLHLAFAPVPGTRLVVVNNTGSAAITGRFPDLADGSIISAVFGGTTYSFLAGYAGGSGNDLVLSLLGPGVPVPEFNPAFASGGVTVALPGGDSQMLVGGEFETVNGVAREHLVKLSPDGDVIPGFSPAAVGFISGIIKLPSGNSIVTGLIFSRSNVSSRQDVALLTPDGTLFSLAKAEGSISAVAVQDDGKILIGGNFGSVNGVSRARLARLHPNGTVDLAFNPTVSSGLVRSLFVQPDQKILVGGSFSSIASTPNRYLGRLHPDGTGDTTLAALPFLNDLSSFVAAITLQADGKILIGGNFSARITGGSYVLVRDHIARVSGSGEMDWTFNPRPDGIIDSLAVQADGKILVGGRFTQIGDVIRNRFARLLPNGTLDPTIDPNFGGSSVRNIALESDGTIIASGGFSSASGVPRSALAVLANHDAVSTFEIASGIIRWNRGGTAPETEKVTFDLFNGGSGGWQILGFPQRVPGGWELAGVTLPSTGVIRARASVVFQNLSYEAMENSGGFGGGAAQMTVTDASGLPVTALDFGSLPMPQSGERALKLTNSGTAALAGISATFEGAAATDYGISPATIPALAPGESATLKVRFTPSGNGSRPGTLRLTGSGVADTVIPLAGEGGGDFSPRFMSGDEIAFSATSFIANGLGFGGLSLGFAPPAGTILKAIDVTGTSTIQGTFAGLANQSLVTSTFGGSSYVFLANYRGGDGNDLTFSLLGPNVADAGYLPSPDLASAPGAMVTSLALQTDGKLIVSGAFTTIGGTSRSQIARINPDGTVDPAFTITATTRAESMAVQADGKILVATSLTAPGLPLRPGIARLNADGTLDLSFQANLTGTVARICLLRNGKVLIGGGGLSMVDGVTRRGVAVLNSNGSLDTGFTANLSGTNIGIYALAEQPDGQLLLGGFYTAINGVARTHFARVSPTGTVDPAFDPKMVTDVGGASSIAIQPDGKILIGGYISMIGNAARNNLARLMPDGTADPGFFAEADNPSTCIRVQADGKIMICGLFSMVNGVRRPGIARLHPDGTLDRSFAPNPTLESSSNPWVYTMLMPEDGKLILGGIFKSVDYRAGRNLARLGEDVHQSTIDMPTPSTIRWSRGGAATELEITIFEVSTNDGASWAPLGQGVRVPGGWELDSASLPPTGFIRGTGRQVLTSRVSATSSRLLVFGRSLSALEQWRQQHFGSPFNQGGGINTGDSDSDGIPNLVEFGFGLNPRSAGPDGLPQWKFLNGSYEVKFTKPPGTDGVAHGAEWSETMAEGEWHPAEDFSSGNDKAFRVPVTDKRNLFFRLKVMAP